MSETSLWSLIADRLHGGEDEVRVVRERYVDYYRSTERNNGVYLARREPLKGYSVYRVGGQLVRTMAPIYNCFVAKTPKEAKERYEYIYGWKGRFVRRITDEEELAGILTNYKRMPI